MPLISGQRLPGRTQQSSEAAVVSSNASSRREPLRYHAGIPCLRGGAGPGRVLFQPRGHDLESKYLRMITCYHLQSSALTRDSCTPPQARLDQGEAGLLARHRRQALTCLDYGNAQSNLGPAAHIVKPARIHPASQSPSLPIRGLDALEDALESLSELAASHLAHPQVDAILGHAQLGPLRASETVRREVLASILDGH